MKQRKNPLEMQNWGAMFKVYGLRLKMFVLTVSYSDKC